MSSRPAKFTQAEIARVIRAAKKEGAKQVEVRAGDSSVIVRLDSITETKPTDTDIVL